MMAGKYKIALVVVFSLAAGFFLGVWWGRPGGQAQRVTTEQAAQPPARADGPSVQRAYRLEAVRNRTSVAQVRELRYPIVMGFPDKVCVELVLVSTAIGGSVIYCFHDSNRDQVEYYQVGE